MAMPQLFIGLDMKLSQPNMKPINPIKYFFGNQLTILASSLFKSSQVLAFSNFGSL